MNRRMFITSSTAVAFLTPSIFLTGCSDATVADFVKVIATDAASLATYFGDATLASQITSLAAQIAIDITNWQSGAAATDAIQAINDLIGLVNLIPAAAQYAPLIVLILSALTGLLALLPNSVAATKDATRAIINTRNVRPTHYNGFDKKSMTTGKKSFESSWTSLAAGLPLTK